ncbi:MAG: trypsin-like peptidase domain-containing protein, partial [Proteobacteria bacterium]|nr:trypsin-like peptidase domain-containing protein [Pseudomonadota bacterium]
MSINRHSFKLGALSSMFVITAVVLGLAFSASMNWIPAVNGSATAHAATNVLPASGNFTEVVKAVRPAVVNISTTRVVKSAGMEDLPERFNDPFFRRFFGDEFFRRFEAPRNRQSSGLGSGVIVDASGYVVTNNHVIENADEIKVTLSDKREFIGIVIGTDPKTDLAVIKIEGKDLPTVDWGDSDLLDVGEFVLAIGSPFGLTQTVTMGIVSAVGRANMGIADYENFIQTDAAINPGNSGGAMVDVNGRLVGINTAIFSRSGGYMGIGFAVPSNMLRATLVFAGNSAPLDLRGEVGEAPVWDYTAHYDPLTGLTLHDQNQQTIDLTAIGHDHDNGDVFLVFEAVNRRENKDFHPRVTFVGG